MRVAKFLIEPGHRITLSCAYVDEPYVMHFIPVDCSSMVLTMVVMNPEDGANVYQYDVTDERVRTFWFDEREIGVSFIIKDGRFLGFHFINCDGLDVSEEVLTF